MYRCYTIIALELYIVYTILF